MITAQIAAEICGKPKRQGAGWMCQCPAHPDDKASLKIDDSEDGKLLVKCFAGCDQDSVIEGLKHLHAWPGSPETAGPAPVPKKNKKKPAAAKLGKIVETYDYVSAEGELLFQAVRYDPKDFRQRRPKPDGGWQYSLGDVQLVPYQLPEVLAGIRNDRYIFIVEGEKDALAMRDRIEDGGCIATCCPMGAGKWRAEFNDYFTDALVVVVADNDEPGRKHADDVANQLRGHAAKVRILELPGVGEHGDICDWIDLGGTKKHLNILVNEIFKEPLRNLTELAMPPPPRGKPDLGVVEPGGAVRKPEIQPKLATDSLHSLWELLNLSLGSGGRPVANIDNALRVIEGHDKLRGTIQYDEFLDRVRSDWGGPLYDWKDSDTGRLTLLMQREVGIHRMPTSLVHEAVMAAAHRNVRNGPLEYMLSVVWDGEARLKDLMPLGFGSERMAYTEAVGRCWMMGMAARVLKPGCKMDNMPVFEGPQGNFKTSALEIIGGEWFVECHEPVTSKDFFQVMQGRMLIEISELHAFHRAQIERIKGIITCRVDRYRKSYGRIAEDHPRGSVFSGTTNRDDWNADETGARRFWPIACGVIDTIWVEDNRDQLFAEAVYLVKDGESWWNVPGDEAKAQQDARRMRDTWEEIVLKFIESEPRCDDQTKKVWWEPRMTPLDELKLSDILEDGLQIQPGRQQRADQMRVAAVLIALGWARKRIKAEWLYVSPNHSLNKKLWHTQPADPD